MFNNTNIDILSRLDAMRVQEETIRRSNYLKRVDPSRGGDAIDEACRGAMVAWIRNVQRRLSLDSETVWIAASFLDRYLSSGRGRGALRSRRRFQLAAITAFYTAAKIHEPVALGLGTLLRICRGMYSKSDVTSMEMEILEALDWRVSCHTPMDFVRDLLQLLPERVLPSDISDAILTDCQKHLDDAVADINVACSRPSDVGIRCLESSLAENSGLSPSEKIMIWERLAEFCQNVQPPGEDIVVQGIVFSDVSPCNPGGSSELATQSRKCHSMRGRSSPICVTKVAWQT